MRRTLAFVQLAAVGVLVGAMAAFSIRPLAPPAMDPACLYPSAPILCAELPSSGAVLSRTLAAPPNVVDDWVFAVLVDMPFLVAYVTLLALAAHRLRASRDGKLFARIAVVALVAAGACDACENVGILRAASQGESSHALATWIRTFALVKFALCSIGCALTFALRARASLVRSPRAAVWASAAVVSAVGIGCLALERLVIVGFLATATSCVVAAIEAFRAARAADASVSKAA